MEKKPWEFNSLEETLSSLSKDPLFSTLVTFYTLVIIYLPSLFLKILSSPVLISTAILLLTLLRLGAIQKGFKSTEDRYDESEIGSSKPSENENSAAFKKIAEFSFPENNAITNTILLENQESGPACANVPKTNIADAEMGLGSSSDPSDSYAESFVEWNVRAPLEVIHEGYEGEGDEQNDDVRNEKTEAAPVSSIERYPSLSLYYPDSDSDGSSDGGDFAGIGGWDSPESTCFMWDEEEKGEDLIEIAFDEKGRSGVVQFEEENLIEINISPARVEDGGRVRFV
ncbi:hypothetical protein RHSIM_Rhsim02G0119500 [Rhododendron simsii]|uniref:Uncharacterized protein n=1 Tax=Rhododendron simsii TaxID=118357 RepID=A0A834HBU5_RHOSS|nr:hypothetical protein RHSIM_Rhsim02G0119500 [Rhododendron simsii]